MKNNRSAAPSSLVLIKIGGSVITDKKVPLALRGDVLKRLVKEISQARREFPESTFIVGHGQGSFAHVPATKYRTMEGFVNEESMLGAAIVHDSAADLNRLVVQAFVDHGVAAISAPASQWIVTAHRKLCWYSLEVLDAMVTSGMLPITGGDVLMDRQQGCTVWSTEEVLSFLAKTYVQRGWKVAQIVHVTETDGVYDESKNLLTEVTWENWPVVQRAITQTNGFDVTGGMGLKIKESLELAAQGVVSKIVSGAIPNNVYHTLANRAFVGTVIR